MGNGIKQFYQLHRKIGEGEEGQEDHEVITPKSDGLNTTK